MLALRGLFVLMTRHDLEYPRFYPLLYALITPFALNGTHRLVFIAHLQACGVASDQPRLALHGLTTLEAARWTDVTARPDPNVCIAC